MAEITGIIASGSSIAQLAGQLASTAIKWKGYWDQIQDAPAGIACHLQQLDMYGHLMSEIENNLQTSQRSEIIRDNNICMEKTLKMCKKSVDDLNVLVV